MANADETVAEASERRNGSENDKGGSDEALGDINKETLEISGFGRERASDSLSKDDIIEMEDAGASGTSGEEWEGEDKDIMSIGSDPMDYDAQSESDEDDAFGDQAAGMEQTDSSFDEASSEQESGSSIRDKAAPNNIDERATLRQMMAESQKTVVATITEASKVDVAKGKAIAHQRTSFDALLNARIHLQKGMIATNSILSRDPPLLEDEAVTSVISNAEAAASKLWNGLEELRQAIQPSASPTEKRVPSPATHSTSTAALWDRMQCHEAQSIPTRRATLAKWSSRLQPLAVNTGRSTLSGASSSIPLLTVLDQHLAAPNRARLLARTQVPRSCAPIQAAAHIPSDPAIYDDADFYATLLRELVDRRMTDSSHNRATGSGVGTHLNGSHSAAESSLLLPPARDRKPRGQVDTRASKGRKMRYTVQEKLQSFMVPEDHGSWGERQAAELFGGLLGRKFTFQEEEEEEDVGEINDDDDGGIGIHNNGVNIPVRVPPTINRTPINKHKHKPKSEEALLMFRR